MRTPYMPEAESWTLFKMTRFGVDSFRGGSDDSLSDEVEAVWLPEMRTDMR